MQRDNGATAPEGKLDYVAPSLVRRDRLDRLTAQLRTPSQPLDDTIADDGQIQPF